MPPKTERRHRQGEASRRKILDAVTQIAAERGYEGTTVALVSERSGLPVSSIYWHFGNKDDLIAAVIQRSHEEWMADLSEGPPITGGESRRDLIATILRHEVGSLLEHPEFLRFGLMLALEERAQEPKARQLFLEVRRSSLERIVAGFRLVLDSEGSSDDAFAEQVARFTLASVDGLFVANQATPDDLELGAHLDLLAVAIDLLIEERVRSTGDEPRGRRRSGTRS